MIKKNFIGKKIIIAGYYPSNYEVDIVKFLKKDYENVKLEHDYLSSAEKLLEFQVMYFDDELVKKDIKNIKIINETMNNLTIEQFKLTDER